MLFSKTKSAQPRAGARGVPTPADLPDLASATARRPAGGGASAPMPASVLSADLAFRGDISGAGELQIDGSVTGDVRVGRLLVGETGAVEGAVQADVVEVRGRVVGSVSGKQVRLTSTAYVDGDITHEQLSVDVGAFFQGRCQQSARPGREADPAPTAEGAQLIELKSSAQG